MIFLKFLIVHLLICSAACAPLLTYTDYNWPLSATTEPTPLLDPRGFFPVHAFFPFDVISNQTDRAYQDFLRRDTVLSSTCTYFPRDKLGQFFAPTTYSDGRALTYLTRAGEVPFGLPASLGGGALRLPAPSDPSNESTAAFWALSDAQFGLSMRVAEGVSAAFLHGGGSELLGPGSAPAYRFLLLAGARRPGAAPKAPPGANDTSELEAYLRPLYESTLQWAAYSIDDGSEIKELVCMTRDAGTGKITRLTLAPRAPLRVGAWMVFGCFFDYGRALAAAVGASGSAAELAVAPLRQLPSFSAGYPIHVAGSPTLGAIRDLPAADCAVDELRLLDGRIVDVDGARLRMWRELYTPGAALAAFRGAYPVARWGASRAYAVHADEVQAVDELIELRDLVTGARVNGSGAREQAERALPLPAWAPFAFVMVDEDAALTLPTTAGTFFIDNYWSRILDFDPWLSPEQRAEMYNRTTSEEGCNRDGVRARFSFPFFGVDADANARHALKAAAMACGICLSEAFFRRPPNEIAVANLGVRGEAALSPADLEAIELYFLGNLTATNGTPQTMTNFTATTPTAAGGEVAIARANGTAVVLTARYRTAGEPVRVELLVEFSSQPMPIVAELVLVMWSIQRPLVPPANGSLLTRAPGAAALGHNELLTILPAEVPVQLALDPVDDDGSVVHFDVLLPPALPALGGEIAVSLVPIAPATTTTTTTSGGGGDGSAGGGGGGGGDDAVGPAVGGSVGGAVVVVVLCFCFCFLGVCCCLCCAGLLLLVILALVVLLVICVLCGSALTGVLVRRAKQSSGDAQEAYEQALREALAEYEREVGKEVPYREIELDELEFAQKLGEGAFGTVYYGMWRGTEVAIKTLHQKTMALDVLHEFRHECEVMHRLGNHPGLVLFIGAVTQGETLALVTEFCKGGSLLDHLERARERSDNPHPLERVRWARDAARGIHQLHVEGVVHRDIAARNCLLTADCRVKIADYGTARFSQDAEEEQKTKNDVGPIRWMAPEALLMRYSTGTDWYSFGVLLYEIETLGVPPFMELPLMEVARQVSQGLLLPKPPKGSCKPLRTIMKGLFKKDAKARMKFAEIMEVLNAALEEDPEEADLDNDDAEKNIDERYVGATFEEAGSANYGTLDMARSASASVAGSEYGSMDMARKMTSNE